MDYTGGVAAPGTRRTTWRRAQQHLEASGAQGL